MKPSPPRKTFIQRINEALGTRITLIVTSMWFLYAFVVFVTLWMWQAPRLHWDTSPNYPVMLYWVNLFQALMLPILAIGQSVLNRKTEERNAHQYEIIQKLDQVLAKMETEVHDIDQEVEALESKEGIKS